MSVLLAGKPVPFWEGRPVPLGYFLTAGFGHRMRGRNYRPCCLLAALIARIDAGIASASYFWLDALPAEPQTMS